MMEGKQNYVTLALYEYTLLIPIMMSSCFCDLIKFGFDVWFILIMRLHNKGEF
jgi:hypothetical protein